MPFLDKKEELNDTPDEDDDDDDVLLESDPAAPLLFESDELEVVGVLDDPVEVDDVDLALQARLFLRREVRLLDLTAFADASVRPAGLLLDGCTLLATELT